MSFNTGHDNARMSILNELNYEELMRQHHENQNELVNRKYADEKFFDIPDQKGQQVSKPPRTDRRRSTFGRRKTKIQAGFKS